jgi:hypothetical protein
MGIARLTDLPVEQALALTVQITETNGLQPVSHHPKQQVAGHMRGRRSPENRVPTVAKLADVEISLARNLDVELFSIRQRRTDPYPRHGKRWRLVF